jgi:hypothetical protein
VSYLRESSKREGFRCSLKMGKDTTVLSSRGSWFHHQGARIEKSFDWG